MRLLLVLSLTLLAPCTFAQTRAANAACAPQLQNVTAERNRLQKLLREKGVDALVEDITRPQKELWKNLKAGLLRREGWSYFWNSVRGAALPDMNGILISQSGSELVLGISDAAVPEVALRLDSPLGQPIQPGTRVLFRGVAADFQPQPFMFIVDVRITDLSFLPAP